MANFSKGQIGAFLEPTLTRA